MRIDILSLFPGYFSGPFDESIIKLARQKGILDIHLVDIRDFAEGKHSKVDDRPYGGGPGMVLMPGPVVKAIRSVLSQEARVVYLTPQGRPLTAAKSEELSRHSHLILLCGHYEGVDERILKQEIHEEISIGDYVLTNGCLSAIVLVDAVCRFIPGVLGHEEAASKDSFQQTIFDTPHYTRPLAFEGLEVPSVLQSGNHEAIQNWRFAEALAKTKEVRPDLFSHYLGQVREKEKSVKDLDPSALPRLVLLVKNLKVSLRFYMQKLEFQLISRGENSARLLWKQGANSYSLNLIEGLNEVGTKSFLVELTASQEIVKRIAKRCGINDTNLVPFVCTDPDGYQWNIGIDFIS